MLFSVPGEDFHYLFKSRAAKAMNPKILIILLGRHCGQIVSASSLG
jgi:hypothetical protein